MPFYQGTTQFWQHLPICFMAAIVDVLIILLLYGLLVAVNKDKLWITKISIGDVALLVILGGIVAIGIESWALAGGGWRYSQEMPILPFVHVGFVPILQMMILPIVTFYTSQLIMKKYELI